jgi:hypothetical protein
VKAGRRSMPSATRNSAVPPLAALCGRQFARVLRA